MVVDRQEATESAVFCLNDSLDLLLTGLFFFLAVRPLSMVLVLEFQFVGDHPPCQLAGRQFWAAGSGLGKGPRSQQKDGRYNGRAMDKSHSPGRRRRAVRFQPVMHVTTLVTETNAANYK